MKAIRIDRRKKWDKFESKMKIGKITKNEEVFALISVKKGPFFPKKYQKKQMSVTLKKMRVRGGYQCTFWTKTGHLRNYILKKLAFFAKSACNRVTNVAILRCKENGTFWVTKIQI